MRKKPDGLENKIRRQKKILGITLTQLNEVLLREGGTLDAIAKVRGISANVRVVVRARHTQPESWAMAVIVGRRIDGIDWERVVRDHRGKAFDCSGWHRHIWDPTTQDALKECLPSFNPTSFDKFIRDGFRILNVQLGKGDGDADDLFRD